MKRVIGITGGIGSGKSLVLSLLEERYQAEVIQADRVAAELEEPGEEGLRRLVGLFGEGILDGAGKLCRPAFAALIFKDPQALLAADAAIHPLVFAKMKEQIEESSAALVAVEAALFDEKSREICQELWFVDASEEKRISRLMESRGYSREKCMDIIRNQADRERFLSFADIVIDNNGTFDEMAEQVGRLIGGDGNRPGRQQPGT